MNVDAILKQFNDDFASKIRKLTKFVQSDSKQSDLEKQSNTRMKQIVDGQCRILIFDRTKADLITELQQLTSNKKEVVVMEKFMLGEMNKEQRLLDEEKMVDINGRKNRRNIMREKELRSSYEYMLTKLEQMRVVGRSSQQVGMNSGLHSLEDSVFSLQKEVTAAQQRVFDLQNKLRNTNYHGLVAKQKKISYKLFHQIYRRMQSAYVAKRLSVQKMRMRIRDIPMSKRRPSFIKDKV